MKRRGILIATVFLMSSWASAHEIRTEDEFDDQPITQPSHSKSIVGFLEWGEVDVYDLLVTPEDMTDGVALITANVLPPACWQYRRFYPSVALVGPGLPEPEVELPFELPPGMGAVVVPGRRVGWDPRPIYTTAEEEMNALVDGNMERCADEGVDLQHVDGDVSWWLPHGLTQECLHCTPWLCPMEDTLFTPVFMPGMYEVWVFNEIWGWGDYNLSMGTGEDGGEVCETLEHTIDLFQRIVDDDLLGIRDCCDAGVSGFEGCEEPPF